LNDERPAAPGEVGLWAINRHGPLLRGDGVALPAVVASRECATGANADERCAGRRCQCGSKSHRIHVAGVSAGWAIG